MLRDRNARRVLNREPRFARSSEADPVRDGLFWMPRVLLGISSIRPLGMRRRSRLDPESGGELVLFRGEDRASHDAAQRGATPSRAEPRPTRKTRSPLSVGEVTERGDVHTCSSGHSQVVAVGS